MWSLFFLWNRIAICEFRVTRLTTYKICTWLVFVADMVYYDCHGKHGRLRHMPLMENQTKNFISWHLYTGLISLDARDNGESWSAPLELGTARPGKQKGKRNLGMQGTGLNNKYLLFPIFDIWLRRRQINLLPHTSGWLYIQQAGDTCTPCGQFLKEFSQFP